MQVARDDEEHGPRKDGAPVAQNIFLVGMMGAGKTSVGKLLAQERNHGVGGGVALLRRLLGVCREEGREGSVKFGGINLPSAVVVAPRVACPYGYYYYAPYNRCVPTP